VHANYPMLALSMVVVAAGMAMVTAPSTGAIVASLPLNKAGVGSAVNDTTRELGGALGVAVVGSVLSSIYRSDIVHRVIDIPATANLAHGSLGSALQASKALPRPSSAALATAARESYVHAFDLTLVVIVAVSLLASALVAWLLRPAPAEEAEQALALEAA